MGITHVPADGGPGPGRAVVGALGARVAVPGGGKGTG